MKTQTEELSKKYPHEKEVFIITINLKKLIKYFLILLIVSPVLLLFFSSRSTPDSPLFYQFKRFQEESWLRLQIAPEAKLRFYDNLLDERMEELQSLVFWGNRDFLWSSSLRYTTTAGRITEILQANNLPSERKYFLEKFSKHQEELGVMLKSYRDKYPDNLFTGEQWKFIQDGINYLDLYKNKLTGAN